MIFEYKTLIYETTGFWSSKIEAEDFDIKLNELAKDNWEIDHCVPVATANYGQTKNIIFIFKREVK